MAKKYDKRTCGLFKKDFRGEILIYGKWCKLQLQRNSKNVT